MAISGATTTAVTYGLASTAAATELIAAVNSPQSSIAAATITNAMLAPSALQSSGVLATSALGYATGAGGAVTQATNRATGVTISKLAGQITTNNASLAAEVSAVFVVTNTLVAIGDVIVLSIQSGMVGLMTSVSVTTVAAGSFQITVANGNAAGGTAETGAIIINFAVIKSVAA